MIDNFFQRPLHFIHPGQKVRASDRVNANLTRRFICSSVQSCLLGALFTSMSSSKRPLPVDGQSERPDKRAKSNNRPVTQVSCFISTAPNKLAEGTCPGRAVGTCQSRSKCLMWLYQRMHSSVQVLEARRGLQCTVQMLGGWLY